MLAVQTMQAETGCAQTVLENLQCLQASPVRFTQSLSADDAECASSMNLLSEEKANLLRWRCSLSALHSWQLIYCLNQDRMILVLPEHQCFGGSGGSTLLHASPARSHGSDRLGLLLRHCWLSEVYSLATPSVPGHTLLREDQHIQRPGHAPSASGIIHCGTALAKISSNRSFSSTLKFSTTLQTVEPSMLKAVLLQESHQLPVLQ